MDNVLNTTIFTEDNINIDDNSVKNIQNENPDNILFELKNWALTKNVNAKAIKS